MIFQLHIKGCQWKVGWICGTENTSLRCQDGVENPLIRIAIKLLIVCRQARTDEYRRAEEYGRYGETTGPVCRESAIMHLLESAGGQLRLMNALACEIGLEDREKRSCETGT